MYELNISKQQSEKRTWTSWLTSFTPTVVSDALYQARDFATVKLSFSNRKKVCGITSIQMVFYVVVFDENGYLYFYKISSEGGECSLAKQHLLLDVASTTNESLPELHVTGDDTVVFRNENCNAS